MNANDYIRKMNDTEKTTDLDAISDLVMALGKEAVEIKRLRSASRHEASIAILKEISKKFDAVKRKASWYWRNLPEPQASYKFIDFAKILIKDNFMVDAHDVESKKRVKNEHTNKRPR